MRAPRFSVIMPVWNRADLVAESVASALAQSIADLELVAVDDGSTDGSADVLERLAAGDSRVVVLRRPHSGMTASLNAGLAHSRGELVALLDSDDLWHRAFLETLARALEGTGPDVGMAFSSYRYFTGSAGERRWLPLRPRCRGGRIHRQLIRKNFVIQDSVLVKRACLDAVGGFAGDLTGYAVDWDLWLRFTRRYLVRHVPRRLTYVRIHGGNLSHDVIRHLRSFIRVLEAERARCASPREAALLGVPRALAWYRLALARRLLALGEADEAHAQALLALEEGGPALGALALAVALAARIPLGSRVVRGAQETLLRLRGRLPWGQPAGAVT